MKTVKFIILVLGFLWAIGIKAQNIITFEQEAYYPEGIAYYEKEGVFLIGSMTKGKISSVSKNGQLKSFITDDALVSALGIKIDPQRNLLFVANSDIGVSQKTQKDKQAKTAEVLVYDISSKKRVAKYDLSTTVTGYTFANDLSFDNDGNLYITNSFGPHVWKLSKDGKPSLFSTHEFFNVAPNHFGLNGIVFHPDGYLIVAHYSKGLLYKIPLNKPNNVQKIQLSFTPIGADGLELLDNKTLIVTANGSDEVKTNMVFKIKTSDNWASGNLQEVIPLEDVFPTTIARVGKTSYVLYGYLNKMLSNAKPPVSKFQIVKIKP